jgi:hypothetical protein
LFLTTFTRNWLKLIILLNADWISLYAKTTVGCDVREDHHHSGLEIIEGLPMNSNKTKISMLRLKYRSKHRTVCFI